MNNLRRPCCHAGPGNASLGAQPGSTAHTPEVMAKSGSEQLLVGGTGGPGAVKPRPGVKGVALGAFLQRLRQET